MYGVRLYVRTAYLLLPKPAVPLCALGTRSRNPARAVYHPERRFSSSVPPQSPSQNAFVSTGRLGKSSRQGALGALLLLGAVLAAAVHYGVINFDVKIERHESPVPGNHEETTTPLNAERIALGLELHRYLKQSMFYLDKDSEEAVNALQRVLQLIDQHPYLLDPASTSGLVLRDQYVTKLLEKANHSDLLRQINVLIKACQRRLDEYDEQGILNVPLQRDLPILMAERVQVRQTDASQSEMTKPDERKLIFQILFGGYQNLIQLFMGDDSSFRNDVMADETIDESLSRMEGEYGPSFERAPIRRRLGSIEIDQHFIYGYLHMLRSRFAINTKPTYSPELALKCMRAITELEQSFEAQEGLSPCARIYTLQCIANLILDLACEAAPQGRLTTDEDRQHLEEAERVQKRVLELAAAVDPIKTDKACDEACATGLISMAKIAWRYGDEKGGDEELAKASEIVDSTNAYLLKEVIRRIDKDPSKTAMKDWEPITAEECNRLIALEAEEDRKSSEDERESR